MSVSEEVGVPTDQTAATGIGQFSKRFGLPEGAALVSVPLFLAAAAVPPNGWRLGFLIAAATLFVTGMFLILKRGSQADAQRRAAKSALDARRCLG